MSNKEKDKITAVFKAAVIATEQLRKAFIVLELETIMRAKKPLFAIPSSIKNFIRNSIRLSRELQKQAKEFHVAMEHIKKIQKLY